MKPPTRAEVQASLNIFAQMAKPLRDAPPPRTDPAAEAIERRRHECEVRYVANMATDHARKEYLDGVALHRGESARLRLRADVWELMRERGGAG